MKADFIKKIFIALCIVVYSIMPVGVFAENSGGIEYSYVDSNVNFSIYRVASADGSSLESDFSDYNVSLFDDSAAKTLASYAQRDGIRPLDTKATDSNNKVSFTGLANGCYLIVGESSVSGKTTYTPMPVITKVLGEVITVTGKYESKTSPGGDEPHTKTLGVMKVWSGSSSEDKAVAQLLKNGEIFQEVTLNQDNNWRYTWTGLDASSAWTVVEKDVDPKYTVSIDKDGDVYIIVNSYTPPSTPDTPTETTETTTAAVRPPSSGGGGGGSTVKPTTPTEAVTEAVTEITTEAKAKEETTVEATTTVNPGTPDTPETPITPDTPSSGGTPDTPSGSEPNPDMMSGMAPGLGNPGNPHNPGSPDDNVMSGSAADLGNPANPNKPGSSRSGRLPQTGQPWLPVPILAFSGILFVIFGMAERRLEE